MIDAERPQPRQLGRIVDIMRNGGVVIYPTDTVYGLGCDMMQKRAVEAIYGIKGKNKRHPLSFICSDLKDLSQFAIVGHNAYRIMKRILPGPYTVILQASPKVPRVMLSQSSTVGIRVPEHAVTRMLVELLGQPIVTTSVPTPPNVQYNDPEEMCRRLAGQVEAVIDSGIIYPEPSTILDLSGDVPRLLRQGKGEIDQIGSVVIEDEV
jgi:tRNA threonylcarbamoyl adenosine modification protein (Sua5/YciO/YrdC/YwlC family)